MAENGLEYNGVGSLKVEFSEQPTLILIKSSVHQRIIFLSFKLLVVTFAILKFPVSILRYFLICCQDGLDCDTKWIIYNFLKF